MTARRQALIVAFARETLLERERRQAIAASELAAATIERLEARIEELEEQLGSSRRDARFQSIRALLRLPPEQCRMVGILLSREFVSKESMYTLIYGHRPECDQPEYKILDVHLCKARKALTDLGVEVQTLWGSGMSMDRENKCKLETLLAEFRPLFGFKANYHHRNLSHGDAL